MRRLLRSIQAGHIASIAASKTTIETTPAKRDDSKEAADFLILNTPANKGMSQDHRIVVFGIGNGGGNDLSG